MASTELWGVFHHYVEGSPQISKPLLSGETGSELLTLDQYRNKTKVGALSAMQLAMLASMVGEVAGLFRGAGTSVRGVVRDGRQQQTVYI